MSFPRYERYKESGVELLGEVPEHWEVTRLKHVASITMGQSPSSEDCNRNGEGVPFLQGNADFGDFYPIPRHYCPVANKFAQKNSILFSVRAPVGAINVADQTYGIGRGLCAITSKGESQRYLLYGLQKIKEELFSVATGSTYEAVSVEQVGNARCLYPPLPEQHTIAAFLDRETAKIDALIAEQQRLIALLAEKRQATISHAVTKGLNPDAPMKDSGIEWLGEIPAHWRTTRLKHVTSIIVDCPHETPVYSEDGTHLVIRTADLDEGRIDASGMYRVSETEYLNRIRRASLLRDDIVYGREGERWGHAALIFENDRFCLGQRMMQFRCAEGFCPEYLMWALNAKTTYTQGDVDTVGATSPHVNVGTIRNYCLAEPPTDDQRKIASFLMDQTQKFDTLTTEAQRAITLLQERRSALISAAVTGKINVQGVA